MFYLKTITRKAFKPKIALSHKEVAGRFGIPDSYTPAFFHAHGLLYSAIGMSYSSTAENIETVFAYNKKTGEEIRGGCVADDWYKSAFPERYKRTHPKINKREGVIFQNPKEDANKFLARDYKTGPQIIHNYYQGIGGSKLGILVVDGTDHGNYEPSSFMHRKVDNIRFCLIGGMKTDQPEESNLVVDSLRVNGSKINAKDAIEVENGLKYGQKLFEQLKEGSYDPGVAQNLVFSSLHKIM